MYKNILFILTVLLFIFLLYKLYQYYQKQKFISEIIEEWQKITNGGTVEQDTETNYEGDYYLSINSDDYCSHIHLIIVDRILKNPEQNYQQTCSNLCYMAKKYNLHSELHIIDQNKSPKTIAEDMYLELYNFKD